MVERISSGSVLILGDGNFSFAKAFCQRLQNQIGIQNPSSIQITASVRDSKEEFLNKYTDEGAENVQWLNDKGIRVLFNVDVEALQKIFESESKFQSIIFNFPHIGGKSNLRRSRELLAKIFQRCSQVLDSDGRLYITLADGQSGLSAHYLDNENSKSLLIDDHLPEHQLDSWQPLHLATYANLLLESRCRFLDEEWQAFGYRCSGYKNGSRRFCVRNGETLIFRPCCSSVSPENFMQIEDDIQELNQKSLSTSIFDFLHLYRPYYVHDMAFWIDDKFQLESFPATVRQLTNNMVKRIWLLSDFSQSIPLAEDSDRLRHSLCFRLIWQSWKSAMTREAARDLQLELRKSITSAMFQQFGAVIELR